VSGNPVRFDLNIDCPPSEQFFLLRDRRWLARGRVFLLAFFQAFQTWAAPTAIYPMHGFPMAHFAPDLNRDRGFGVVLWHKTHPLPNQVPQSREYESP